MQNLHFDEETGKLKVQGISMGELCQTEDGFYQFFPVLINRGYWPPWILRAIADKVDEINKEYKKEVEKVNQEPQETPVKPTLTKIDPPCGIRVRKGVGPVIWLFAYDIYFVGVLLEDGEVLRFDSKTGMADVLSHQRHQWVPIDSVEVSTDANCLVELPSNLIVNLNKLQNRVENALRSVIDLDITTVIPPPKIQREWHHPDTSTAAGLLALHESLCAAGRALMEKKNADYRGGSGDPYANFKGSSTFGIHPIVGILLRMQDKMKRIESFVAKGELQVKGESVQDSLIDLINYSVLIAGMIQADKK